MNIGNVYWQFILNNLIQIMILFINGLPTYKVIAVIYEWN